VAYDIKDEKRLIKIFRKMRRYGNRLQYSVFICKLSEIEKTEMIIELMDIMRTDEDSLIIVDLGVSVNAAENRMKFIGAKPDLESEEVMVV
jgi:CRISPR-associated protein Cas2